MPASAVGGREAAEAAASLRAHHFCSRARSHGPATGTAQEGAGLVDFELLPCVLGGVSRSSEWLQHFPLCDCEESPGLSQPQSSHL